MVICVRKPGKQMPPETLNSLAVNATTRNMASSIRTRGARRIVTKSYYPAGYLLLSGRIPDNLFFMKYTKFPLIET